MVSRLRRWGALSRLIVPVLALLITMASPVASASTVDQYTHVVAVHGYGACQDALSRMIGPISEQYYTGTPINHLHAIAYYGCDTDGESIQGLGPLNSPACVSADEAVRATCPAFLQSPDNDFLNTDLRRYSYELAWYLYNNFGSTTPLALVGHSMGGLIITYALQQIAAHNPDYPSALAVQSVITFSTPFRGLGNGYKNGVTDLEQRQFMPSGNDSVVPRILRGGAPQLYAPGKTMWQLIGSSAGCDLLPASSSLALSYGSNTVYKIDYTGICYDHMAYLYDAFKPANATGKLNGVPVTTGYHSLDAMHSLILNQEKKYNARTTVLVPRL